MSSVNKVIIVGRLGRDPELRYTQGGQAVASLNVATSSKYTNKNNETVEETEWHRVTVWGKTAEHCNNYLSKGSQVYVEGKLKTSSYDKDGVKHYKTEIHASQVTFLDGKSQGDGQRGGGRGKPQDQEPADPMDRFYGGAGPGGDDLPPPDDIPF